MTEKTKTPRAKKPDAQVVGTIEDVMRMPECEDSRSLFAFERNTIEEGGEVETLVLAVSELQAWKAMHSEIGTVTKVTQGGLTERYRQYSLKLSRRNNDIQDTKEPAKE